MNQVESAGKDNYGYKKMTMKSVKTNHKKPH